MPWPVYLAFKQLFPTGRGVSFFAVLSVIGVMLGVALLIVTRSIMGGFGHQVERMIIDTQGEVQIRGRGTLRVTESLEKSIASVPEVAAFAPYAHGVIMLEFDHRPAFPAVQGFDIERMKQVIPLERYITQGSLDDLDDDSVILSAQLAYGLGVRIGDKVSVYSPLMLERLKKNEMLLPRDVRVAGIFLIGHQQLDSSTVICSLRLMQDLYGMDQLVHGYNVRLKPGANPAAAADALNRVLQPEAGALTWFEANADFQAVLAFERNMITFLLGFIILVAAFAIAIALLMSVVRKTREIGLISAMGGRKRDVAASFCLQGFLIGIVGAALGLGAGLAAIAGRNEAVGFLTKITMDRATFERFYQFSNLPANTRPVEVVIILISAVFISTLAGLLPAWRAARLKPVEALRSE
ncbi:MAG TPA: ABC transporter permease [Lacunisphaera sp.]|nr:ABC transporter permease [Lacunisphaera sp.]